MLIPESWILHPLLSMMGYGPYGPIKGGAIDQRSSSSGSLIRLTARISCCLGSASVVGRCSEQGQLVRFPLEGGYEGDSCKASLHGRDHGCDWSLWSDCSLVFPQPQMKLPGSVDP